MHVLLTSGFGLLFVIYLIYKGLGILFYERLPYVFQVHDVLLARLYVAGSKLLSPISPAPPIIIAVVIRILSERFVIIPVKKRIGYILVHVPRSRIYSYVRIKTQSRTSGIRPFTEIRLVRRAVAICSNRKIICSRANPHDLIAGGSINAYGKAAKTEQHRQRKVEKGSKKTPPHSPHLL